MSVHYDIYNFSDENSDEAKGFARPISGGTIDTEQLLRQISVNRGMIEVNEARAVLVKVCDAIKTTIADGYDVHIDGLGYFSPKLKTTWSDDKRRKTPDVVVSGINFTVEREVKSDLEEIETVQTFQKNRSYGKGFSDEELDAMVVRYLEENVTITRQKLQDLVTFLSKTSACAYLNRCVEKGLLKNVGSKNSPVYVKG